MHSHPGVVTDGGKNGTRNLMCVQPRTLHLGASQIGSNQSHTSQTLKTPTTEQ